MAFMSSVEFVGTVPFNVADRPILLSKYLNYVPKDFEL